MFPIKIARYILCTTLFYLCISMFYVDTAEIDMFVVKINGSVILDSEIETQVRLIRSGFLEFQPEMENIDRKLVIEQLINRMLLLSEARRFVTINSDNLNNKYNEIVESTGGMQNFRSLLRATELSDDEFKEYIRESLLIEAYIDQRIKGFVTIQQKDVSQYIKENPNAFGDQLDLNSNKDGEKADILRNLVHQYLTEKEINYQIEMLLDDLRSNADIKYIDSNASR